MSAEKTEPAATEARVAELEAELSGALRRLDEVELQRQEYLETLQRVAAEFENFKKRAVRDREALVTRATERLARELLPVLDDLERALELSRAHDEAKLVEGVTLVARNLRAVLEKEGLEEIPTDGAFDPHVHEALLSQPSEAPEGSVIQVIQKGYRLGEHVVRPARVVVAAPPSAEDGE
jgi:molecular chaperone GrpE